MKKVLSLLLMISSVLSVSSQIQYPCDSIDPYLRLNANAVIRSRQEKVTLMNEKRARTEIKIVITLLNEEAEDELRVSIPYTTLQKVKYIRAFAYNAAGKLVWTLKSFEIADVRDFSGPEILSDERMKVFEFPSFNYPFTIEYSYGFEGETFTLNPVNYLQPGASVSLEASGLQYIVPAGVRFNYRTLGLKNPTDSMVTSKNLVYTWQEENIPARRQRNYAPPLIKTLPTVYATLLNYDIQGYKGSFESWKSFGASMNSILAGRNTLSPEYAGKARTLVQLASGRREKVKILYEYLQKTTRYFYVGFGIGGYQPLPADEVAANGYGDCKALSNYMTALLKAVGIESYYTLVNSGANEFIEPRFPGNQFDHVIVCVPDAHDTIWLECTSQVLPFDYLGSFTCNRDVLAITPEGGRLLKTPEYKINENTAVTSALIRLYGSGDADIDLNIKQSGLMYEELLEVSERKSDERKEWMAGLVNSASFEVTGEEYTFPENLPIPVGQAKIGLHIRNLCSKSSNRLYIAPAVLDKTGYLLEDPTEVDMTMAFAKHDSVKIEIPLGYQVEFLPSAKTLETRFGTYECRVKSDNRYIYFTRILEFNRNTYPRDNYDEFYRFITGMATNDRQMAVLKSTH